jgi:hypothetical protein
MNDQTRWDKPEWDKPEKTVLSNGDIYYICGCINYHRDNGPAIVRTNGTVEWWYKDHYHDFDQWVTASGCSPEQAVMLKLQYC